MTPLTIRVDKRKGKGLAECSRPDCDFVSSEEAENKQLFDVERLLGRAPSDLTKGDGNSTFDWLVKWTG